MKIIQYKDNTWGAKKRGWFGWKYLNEISDSTGNWYYYWCYHIPKGIICYDKFETKKECIEGLSRYYHGHRKLK